MEEFKRGWTVVLAALVGISLSSVNVIIYTFGMFMPKLVDEFGWSHSGTQLALLFSTVGVLVGIPLIGRVCDRFGDRKVTIVSILAFSLAFAGYSLVNSLLFFYLITVVATVVGVGTLPITWTRLLAMWFTQRRGLALGAALLGTGVGAIVLKPYTSFLISQFGWRGAYLGIAVLPLVTALPLAIRFFRTPSAIPTEDAVGSSADGNGTAEISTGGVTLKEARADWRFWVLGLAFLPISFVVGALIANMETILETQGLVASDIVTLVTFIGVAVIFGRIAGGYLLDRLNAAVIGASLVALLALACVLLTFSSINYWQALLVVVLLGLGSGVEYDVLAFLTAKLFGLKAYSRIYGAMLMFFFTGGALGPVAFGAVFDSSGSYNRGLYASALALFVSAILLLSVRHGRPSAAPKTVNPETVAV